jgi:membrane-bound ClpP family serine protease
MTTILLLFAVGILLLALDVFAGSFLLAAIGAAVMAAGCALTYRHSGSFDAGLAGLTAVFLLGGTVYLELFILPRTRFGRGLVVHSTSGTAQPAPALAEAVVGREASALTTLAPSGYVLVAGQRYEAFCQSGHAPLGAVLRVIGVDNFRLIVAQA